MQGYIAITAPIVQALDLLQREHNLFMGYVLLTVVTVKAKLELLKQQQPLKFCETSLDNMTEGVEDR